MPPSTIEFDIRRVHGEEHAWSTDVVAIEEPLEIRLSGTHDGEPFTTAVNVTMRTPGHDLELAAGFLWSEGIVRAPGDILSARHCGVAEGASESNTVLVVLRDGLESDLQRLQRHFTTTSSCGVCGKTSLEAVATRGAPSLGHGPELASGVVHALPGLLRRAQTLFDSTGGLHATGLFTPTGTLCALREDVGRHNALDKVIGREVLDGRPSLHDKVLVVSGRASFELVQKAIMARAPVLVAVGAPSSLAVELARAHGLTLVGFTRNDRFNVYSGGERLRGGP